jgi:hypothetical protein
MNTDSDAKTPAHTQDRPFLGMLCKIIAMLMFAIMFAAVRWLGPAFSHRRDRVLP